MKALVYSVHVYNTGIYHCRVLYIRNYPVYGDLFTTQCMAGKVYVHISHIYCLICLIEYLFVFVEAVFVALRSKNQT